MIAVIPGSVDYVPNFLDASDADELFARLADEQTWRLRHEFFDHHYGWPARCIMNLLPGSDRFKFDGRSKVPADTWSDEAMRLKTRLDARFERGFNSVFVNYYRDGKDAMGLHNDIEYEIGDDPIITCVSLGASREFLLTSVNDASVRHSFIMEHGSLVVMRGDCQKVWRHGVPEMHDVLTPRISLTFREVKFMSP